MEDAERGDKLGIGTRCPCGELETDVVDAPPMLDVLPDTHDADHWRRRCRS
jgi:hypothetical protein